MTRILARALALGCFCAIALSAGNIPATEIRSAAQRAITVIERAGKTWYEKQTCVSCHHQVLPMLAFDLARSRGLDLDERLARRNTARAFSYLADIDHVVQGTHVIDPAMSDGYQLLAAHAAGLPSSVTLAALARFVARHQRPEGYWPTIDQRPPQSSSRFTATAISLHALQLYMPEKLSSEARRRVQDAGRWLLAVTPRTTEDSVFRLLGLGWSGADDAVLDIAARRIVGQQQQDGGWAQIAGNIMDDRPGRESDAYSTGEALYALHTAAHLPVTHPAYQRGLRFLLNTQKPDGSWLVESRIHPPAPVSPPYFETGFPYSHNQFISCSGSSFAAMALLLALNPKPRYRAKPLHLAEVSPPAPEDWMETALFGTAADLDKLLAAGLDVNRNTAGGTTLLMMSAADPEKVKLLLERGADVNARSKSGYTALLVATNYGGSAESVRLLLEKGASPQPDKPMFNASPLALAALAGNQASVRMLIDKGASIRHRMLLLGLFQVSPLILSAQLGDANMSKLLIERGADVNEEDNDGITPLGWSVLADHTAQSRMLIENGANVNHVDKLGMTPLLYGATIDYGNTETIETLLKAKADPAIKNKEGATAIDQARRYHHLNIVTALASGPSVPAKK